MQRWTEGTRGRGWLWGQVWGHKSVFFMLQIRSRCWWDYTNSVITHPTVPAVHKMYIPRYYYFVSLDELKCKNTNFMKNIIARPNCSESVPPGDCCKHYIGLSQCHMCGGSVDRSMKPAAFKSNSPAKPPSSALQPDTQKKNLICF